MMQVAVRITGGAARMVIMMVSVVTMLVVIMMLVVGVHKAPVERRRKRISSNKPGVKMKLDLPEQLHWHREDDC